MSGILSRITRPKMRCLRKNKGFEKWLAKFAERFAHRRTLEVAWLRPAAWDGCCVRVKPRYPTCCRSVCFGVALLYTHRWTPKHFRERTRSTRSAFALYSSLYCPDQPMLPSPFHASHGGAEMRGEPVSTSLDMILRMSFRSLLSASTRSSEAVG
jgi:hypothetical protein